MRWGGGVGGSPFLSPALLIFLELAFDLNKNLLHQFLIASIVICINIEVNKNKYLTLPSYTQYSLAKKTVKF